MLASVYREASKDNLWRKRELIMTGVQGEAGMKGHLAWERERKRGERRGERGEGREEGWWGEERGSGGEGRGSANSFVYPTMMWVPTLVRYCLDTGDTMLSGQQSTSLEACILDGRWTLTLDSILIPGPGLLWGPTTSSAPGSISLVSYDNPSSPTIVP